MSVRTFRSIDDRPINWLCPNGKIHACEGSYVHPSIRLIWTLCEIDVPADQSYLPGDEDGSVDCEKCRVKLAEG